MTYQELAHRIADALDALVMTEQILRLEDVLCSIPSREQRVAWILRHVEGEHIPRNLTYH